MQTSGRVGSDATTSLAAISHTTGCVHSMAVVRAEILEVLLRHSLEDINDGRCRFIPRDALFDVVSPSRVKQALLDCAVLDPEEETLLNQTTTYVAPHSGGCRCRLAHCTGARVIFVALLSLSEERLITSFLKTSDPAVCDKDLAQSGQQVFDSPVTNFPITFQSLSDEEKAIFFHQTLRMRSPYIEAITQREDGGKLPSTVLEFDRQVSLPWSSLEEGPELVDGEVTMVQNVHIHPSHHDFVSIISPSIEERDGLT